ncbi:MAG: DNA polymerase III subunit gamma/tau [Deltaproteobacteria bacterium]|nr:DNA polymerase III subunit gamma/tau [Deltaproteobacteria bacterium]
MAYLVLARKWRPRGFDAITGQEHVTRTLKNAIQQNRVHHAFLFCGARGVGKTSAARVLARALNCRSADGPTIDPCGTCPACTEIAAGTSIDVFEIDGASNRGIGEIRELRDGVAYAPQRDRFKIYIIDEVHMLTTEAFNALLKTLEEPPAHVKFIFATTEPHKIPVTILSRCQRFDFKRIPMATMVKRLSEILEAEEVRIDEGGLRLVARESEGSMRDALSLLDRVISSAGQTPTYQAVVDVLGVADRAWLHRLVGAALDKDVKTALGVVEEAFEYGLDLRKFASDVVHYLRDIAVLQVAGEGAPTDLSRDEVQSLAALGRKVAPEDLQRLIRLATETAERLVQASFPRLEMEMAVIRMSRLSPVVPIDALLARLEGLERRLDGGPRAATVAAVMPPAPPAPAVGTGAAPRPKAEPQAERLGPVVESAPQPPVIAPSPPVIAPLPPPVMAPPPAPVVAPEPPPTIAAPLPDVPPTPSLPFAHDDWETFVDLVRGDQPVLAGLLDHARVASFDGGVLALQVSGDVTQKRLQAGLLAVEELVRAQRPDVVGVRLAKVERVEDTPRMRKNARDEAEREQRRKELERHPLVLEIVERFGGTLAEIRVQDVIKEAT